MSSSNDPGRELAYILAQGQIGPLLKMDGGAHVIIPKIDNTFCIEVTTCHALLIEFLLPGVVKGTCTNSLIQQTENFSDKQHKFTKFGAHSHLPPITL